MNSRLHTSFFWAANVIVAVALLWGFILAGSPMSERLRKLDERRISDLRAIQGEISSIVGIRYVDDRPTMENPLPKTLEEVADRAQYYRPTITDPETGETYRYTVTGRSTFSLCAEFHLANEERYDPAWNHPAGPHCYEFDVLSDKSVPLVREPLVPVSE